VQETVLAPVTSAFVNGLRGGIAYKFTVHATNAVGTAPNRPPRTRSRRRACRRCRVCPTTWSPTRSIIARLAHLDGGRGQRQPDHAVRANLDAGDHHADRRQRHASDEQRKVAEQVKAEFDHSGRFKQPIVTEISAATPFYIAEDYHQKYLVKHPDGYTCHVLRD